MLQYSQRCTNVCALINLNEFNIRLDDQHPERSVTTFLSLYSFARGGFHPFNVSSFMLPARVRIPHEESCEGLTRAFRFNRHEFQERSFRRAARFNEGILSLHMHMSAL